MKKDYLATILLLIAFEAFSQSLWTKKQDFPAQGSGRWCGVSFTLLDKGYVGTGEGPGGTLLKDFWQYDPTNDLWTQVQDLLGPARADAVSFVINGKSYVGTGQLAGTEQFANDFYSYDPLTIIGHQFWGHLVLQGNLVRLVLP